MDNQVIILKGVTRKSMVEVQLNTHTFYNATVTTSYKFKEIERKSCAVIQLCLSTHIRSLRGVKIGPRQTHAR